MKKIVMILFMVLLSAEALASNDEMNRTVSRIINQINAIMPLIDEAKKEQDKNPRVKIHFDSFVDSNGLKHPGLRQDLIAMREALVRHINRPALEPKTIKPLANDFLGAPNEF